MPGRAAEVPFFVSHLLAGLDPWAECVLWPRGGAWPRAGGVERPGDQVRGVVLQGAGIPAGCEGAVRYGAGEADKLVAVLFAHLVFGWSVPDDLFVVPDHARQMLQTDHHDVVHVAFADEAGVEPFVRHMANEEYLLPKEPPDPTFKKPGWMV